jgi:hypothetical protein
MTENETKAWRRGTYCNAYETQDWVTARAMHCDKLAELGPTVAQAFLCGFFSSYKLHEVSDEIVREELAQARLLFKEEG